MSARVDVRRLLQLLAVHPVLPPIEGLEYNDEAFQTLLADLAQGERSTHAETLRAVADDLVIPSEELARRAEFLLACLVLPASGTYYELLDVTPDASAQEIRKRWAGLIQRYHPDRVGGASGWLDEQARRLIEAYQTLRDPDRRRQYDRQLALSAPVPEASFPLPHWGWGRGRGSGVPWLRRQFRVRAAILPVATRWRWAPAGILAVGIAFGVWAYTRPAPGPLRSAPLPSAPNLLETWDGSPRRDVGSPAPRGTWRAEGGAAPTVEARGGEPAEPPSLKERLASSVPLPPGRRGQGEGAVPSATAGRSAPSPPAASAAPRQTASPAPAPRAEPTPLPPKPTAAPAALASPTAPAASVASPPQPPKPPAASPPVSTPPVVAAAPASPAPPAPRSEPSGPAQPPKPAAVPPPAPPPPEIVAAPASATPTTPQAGPAPALEAGSVAGRPSTPPPLPSSPAAATAVAKPEPVPTAKPSLPSPTREELLALVEGFRQAYERKDLRAVMTLLGAQPRDGTLVGRGPIEQQYTRTFATLDNIRYELAELDVRSGATEGDLVVQGRFRIRASRVQPLAAPLEVGGPIRWTLRREGDALRIVGIAYELTSR